MGKQVIVGQVVRCMFGSVDSEEFQIVDAEVLAINNHAGVVRFLCREVGVDDTLIHARTAHHDEAEVIANVCNRLGNQSVSTVAKQMGFDV